MLDLGCGNGALLKELREECPAVVPYGIDVDESRIAHARELLPDVAGHFVAGDLFAADSLWPEGRRYALALVMPGRLLEVGPARAARLRARLERQCDRVLVYAYGDWLTRHGDLQGLAAAAGFRVFDAEPGAAAALGFACEVELAGPDGAHERSSLLP